MKACAAVPQFRACGEHLAAVDEDEQPVAVLLGLEHDAAGQRPGRGLPLERLRHPWARAVG